MASAMESVYKRHSTAFDLVPKELFKGIVKTLDSAVSDDFQAEYPDLCKMIHENNEVFAAFKVHDQCERMAKLLLDEEGNLKSFEQWSKEAEPISSHHNKVWLRTEYDTAIKRAEQARQWKQFENERDVLPNLRWVPSTAATPGADHMIFWDTVRPVDDPFWNSHKPGDRWGCQCSLEATDEPETDIPAGSEMDEPAPGLDNNPAKDGKLFSDSHPYYPGSCSSCPFNTGGATKRAPTNMAKDCVGCLYIERIIGDHVRVTGIPSKYEDFGEGWKKVLQENGGYLVTEIERIPLKESGNDWKKYQKELSMCINFAKAGHKIVFLREKGRDGLYDILFDGKSADLKKTRSLSSLDHYVTHALRDQKAEIVLLEFEIDNRNVHTKLEKYRRAGIPIYYYFTGREGRVFKL